MFQKEGRGERLEENVPVSGCGLLVPSWWQDPWGWDPGLMAGAAVAVHGAVAGQGGFSRS